MPIYTKTGDKGETSLFGGKRVGKDSLRVWVYGTMDEADSVLGVVYSTIKNPELKEAIRHIQKDVFVMNAEIASDEKGYAKLQRKITGEDVAYLEHLIDHATELVGKYNHFTIPGASSVSSFMHLARTIVRRAERHLVELSKTEEVPADVLKYVNRLSDCLYMLAKQEVLMNFIDKVKERVMELAGQGAAESIGGSAGASGKILTSSLCNKLCEAAAEKGAEIKVPVSVAVVDTAGRLKYFYRQEGAILVSLEIAQKKAYTAVAMKQPSGNLLDAVVPGGSLYSLTTADSNIVAFGGGFPLRVNGELIGGLGISGGTADEDVSVAKHVLEVFDKILS
jgi:ATP:cob(I)alamin adenosyltransferase